MQWLSSGYLPHSVHRSVPLYPSCLWAPLSLLSETCSSSLCHEITDAALINWFVTSKNDLWPAQNCIKMVWVVQNGIIFLSNCFYDVRLCLFVLLKSSRGYKKSCLFLLLVKLVQPQDLERNCDKCLSRHETKVPIVFSSLLWYISERIQEI